MKISKILVPTDFSDCARAAVDHALFVARRFDARIDLLNVWELPINVLPDWIVQAPGEPAQPITALVRGTAAMHLEKLVGELRTGYDNLRGRLETGDAGEQIVEIAKRDGYDLIVIGTHGRTGLSHLWSGSVAEEVVRRAPCAVMTVRAQERAHV